MLGIYFYHERIRKSVAMFGSLFNNIFVLRKDASGKVLSTVKVPLSYAPKRDFLERLRENPDLTTDTKVAIKLPRMSFEIIGYQYDTERQLPKTSIRNKPSSTGDTVRSKLYNYVPYSIDMQLNVYAKTQDDALQIVEQILPFFSPQYTLTIKPFADYPEIKEDVPITLNGVSYSDDYDGALGDRRSIIYQLDFRMQANFYQGISDGSIIRKAINNIYPNTLVDSDATGTYIPTPIITIEPNPLDASADSDYGFTETYENQV
jgi:hypothetical protein